MSCCRPHCLLEVVAVAPTVALHRETGLLVTDAPRVAVASMRSFLVLLHAANHPGAAVGVRCCHCGRLLRAWFVATVLRPAHEGGPVWHVWWPTMRAAVPCPLAR